MSSEHEIAPRELLDIDFRDFVRPPASNFTNTLRLFYGWGAPSKESLDRAPFLANYDPTDEYVEQMLRYATSVYEHFGGGEGKLQFGISYEEVLAYVEDTDNKDQFMVYNFEEEIASIAHRYLTGEGEDYDLFHQIQETI